MPTQQEAFLEWLKKSQAELAAFVTIIKKFMEQQTPGVPAGSGAGPTELHVGEEHPLTTVGLSLKEIDDLNLEMADAVVVERAIAWVKGFIAGLTILGGAA
jgi:hypothetical protein